MALPQMPPAVFIDIGLEAFWQTRRIEVVCRVAGGARRAGSAARTRALAFPWPLARDGSPIEVIFIFRTEQN